jgi:hypothetical protein
MNPVPPNNPMQRAGHDKVRAPDCSASFTIKAFAQRPLRAVADGGRYAALPFASLRTEPRLGRYAPV